MKLIKLFESELTDDQIVQQIKDNCGPYLKSSDYTELYRGMKDIEVNFEIKKVRTQDRKPLDTDRFVHDAINVATKNEYGFPFRNGLFVTRSTHTAAYYGNLYVVFPVGKFNYIQSQKIHDLYDHLTTDQPPEYTKILSMRIPLDEKIKTLAKYFQNDIFHKHYKYNSGMKTAQGEIMIECEQYIIISEATFKRTKDQLQ